ncbi:hypothetical protein [Nonomuraea sp. NPDC049784]|uniref:hypothetical protein n=1 Tax=Nonomuraea sp. NPDC049784 TaxID=3154361 RepID=UPI00340D0320
MIRTISGVCFPRSPAPDSPSQAAYEPPAPAAQQPQEEGPRQEEEQSGVLDVLEKVGSIVVPLGVTLYALLYMGYQGMYAIFGIIPEQAGIDQSVLLGRLLGTLLPLLILGAIVVGVLISVGWLLNVISRGLGGASGARDQAAAVDRRRCRGGMGGCVLSCVVFARAAATEERLQGGGTTGTTTPEHGPLRRQVQRVRYEPADRLWLAAVSHLIPRCQWGRCSRAAVSCSTAACCGTNATYSTPCVSTNSSTTGTVLIKPWIKRLRNAPSRNRSRIRRESST